MFWNFSSFPGKNGFLAAQHRLENFSSISWIRRGVISCAPHISFDEIKDSVVKCERGELVGAPALPWCTVLTLRSVMCGGRRSGFC